MNPLTLGDGTYYVSGTRWSETGYLYKMKRSNYGKLENKQHRVWFTEFPNSCVIEHATFHSDAERKQMKKKN